MSQKNTTKESSVTDNTENMPLTRWQAFKKEWGGFLILLFCLFCFRSVIADWNAVPTGSMKPTIYEGDRIWVNKLSYGLRIPFTNIRVATLGQPKRGEIVVFPEPISGKRYIKRAIGIPGDLIEVKDNLVYLNGKRLDYREYTPEELKTFADVPGSSLDENNDLFFWLEESIGDTTHPIQILYPQYNRDTRYRYYRAIEVPKGKIFVMGDNRDQSQDSRRIGLVDTNTLIGKATRVAWSHNYDNYYWFRGKRFFKPIDELSETD
ncbi:MAG: signal peptidase I [Gammaproteobacteria bacterium]|nr:signal peptidase I [Gammaproteobacteria bacterium]NNC97070.1 signal peptidase I [Gammaproteobacteria bacterium]NNM14334.1 signal peptidase I [Gammaproteobacteria bacterium]